MGTGLIVESKKLESGPWTISAGFPSSQSFVVGGQSGSNLLASTVKDCNMGP